MSVFSAQQENAAERPWKRGAGQQGACWGRCDFAMSLYSFEMKLLFLEL